MCKKTRAERRLDRAFVEDVLHESARSIYPLCVQDIFSLVSIDPLAVTYELVLQRQSNFAMGRTFPVRYLQAAFAALNTPDEMRTLLKEGRGYNLDRVVKHMAYSGLAPYAILENFEALKNGLNPR